MHNEQYVIITHYQPPGENKRPIVHVWGPLPSRGRALTVQQQMRRTDWDSYGEDAMQVRYWVRPIRNPEHP